MAKAKIKDPILLKHAQDEFGLGRKWFLPRIERGEIRSARAGRHIVLERSDIEKLAPDQEEMDLVEKARRRHSKRQRG